jgi:hypothetical protein
MWTIIYVIYARENIIIIVIIIIVIFIIIYK